MSEIIQNSSQRKEMLRHLLLRLHEGEAPDVLRKRLIEVLRSIPYNEVVEVEQELINSGALSENEILEFCDLHTAVLDGSIDLEDAKTIPPGHPVDTFKKENEALKAEVNKLVSLFNGISSLSEDHLPGYILQLRTGFNNLWDVDKHYKRKEYLLFPYLEKHLITGPPKVMWGKHDEIRSLLKNASEALASPISTAEEM
ncbi:MAG TPA: DUF438 domain-containing protein, partial [Porphyromonadaceae bacterium]|nr:DUF438 domain-containing protein [Porphyromonadaceae bacterium]